MTVAHYDTKIHEKFLYIENEYFDAPVENIQKKDFNRTYSINCQSNLDLI